MPDADAVPPARLEGGPDPSRLAGLDGLRGLAALVVLVHHGMLVLPTLSRVQEAGHARDGPWWAWALTHTPLHLAWLGEEAVVVFFVLSGFVLAVPAARPTFRWSAYYPQRLVRLYLPVWASLVLAAVVLLLLPRDPDAAHSSWVAARAGIDPGAAWTDALLLGGVSTVNAPLWSLRWEVVFSLLLPVYVLAARRARRWAPTLAVALLAAIAVGTLLGDDALRYLPIFGLGVLMAFHRRELGAWASWMDARRRPRAAWALLAAATGVALTGRWIVEAVPVSGGVLGAAGSGAAVVGAAGAVLLALHWPDGVRALRRAPVQWLGRRSFSLYLVHEPVVIALAFVLPADRPWLPAAAAVALSLLVTAAFYRMVEAPSHRLARSVGRRAVRDRAGARPGGGALRPALLHLLLGRRSHAGR